MLSVQAVRGLSRQRAPGAVPCVVSFSPGRPRLQVPNCRSLFQEVVKKAGVAAHRGPCNNDRPRTATAAGRPATGDEFRIDLRTDVWSGTPGSCNERSPTRLPRAVLKSAQ